VRRFGLFIPIVALLATAPSARAGARARDQRQPAPGAGQPRAPGGANQCLARPYSAVISSRGQRWTLKLTLKRR
jgi:hypothetical protein